MENYIYVCSECGERIEDTTRRFCPKCFKSIGLTQEENQLEGILLQTHIEESVNVKIKLANENKENMLECDKSELEDEICEEIQRYELENVISKSTETSDLRYVMKTIPSSRITGYGSFKVDVDPRNKQDIRTREDLYFFLDGSLGVSDSLLIFRHSDHTCKDISTVEIKIKEIQDFKWHRYDKSLHDVYGEEIRYLIRGAFRKPWWEVGYFWLPGGRSTEMECIITEQSGRESYFNFKGTPGNMRAIEEMGTHIQRMKMQI